MQGIAAFDAADTAIGSRRPAQGQRAQRWMAPLKWARQRRVKLAGLLAAVSLGSLALVNYFGHSGIGSPNLRHDAEQAAGIIEQSLQSRVQLLGSIASEPTIVNAADYPATAQRRLQRYMETHRQFDALLVADRQGRLLAQAGSALPINWSDASPVTRSQLLQRGSHPIQLDGGKQVTDVLLTFPAQLDTGLTGPVVMGLINASALADETEMTLYGEEAQAGAPEAITRFAVNSLRPARDYRPEVEMVALTDAQLLGEADGASVYEPISSIGVSKPWQVMLQGPASQPPAMPLLQYGSALLAVAAVAAAVAAGQGLAGRAPVHARAFVRRGFRAGNAVAAEDVAQRLVAVQEAVRREMSDYLHGHVQSKLLALSMMLQQCHNTLERNPQAADQMLERVRQELQKIQDEDVRRVSRELYPAVIKRGLSPAIRSLTNRFAEQVKIEITIDPRLEELERDASHRLPEDRRLGAYRVAEEALSNVMKHAQATRAQVTLLLEENDWVIVRVQDNGRGFDLNSVVSSQGLVGMEDYARAVGGYTRVNSAPGKGATVEVMLPLNTVAVAATAAESVKAA